ncbi:hypothetical protein ANASTE_00543 [Anaerofustis stercorihominis DSM 17244]|uniref:Uncharacterized protein n=1 Tax=Anaerofustis stercorihominis DSM 17244 TaxID=445971 RepID=B1C745_9FIRM|nr:hypothetical protein ANASTE_00543 [Anaerofustis stercorihominis DSM 17244]
MDISHFERFLLFITFLMIFVGGVYDIYKGQSPLQWVIPLIYFVVLNKKS